MDSVNFRIPLRDPVPYLYVLLVAAYPFAVAVMGFVLESTTISSVVSRAAFFFLLLFFGLKCFSHRKKTKAAAYQLAGIFFFGAYGLRLLFELDNPKLYADNTYILALFFLGTVPSFLVFSSARVVPESYRVVNFLFNMVFFTLACLVCQIWLAGNITAEGIARGRLSLEAVNPLTLGLLGAHLLLLSVFCFFEKTKKIKFAKTTYIAGAALGILVIVMSGSRSPLIAAFVSCWLYFYISFRHSRRISMVLIPILLAAMSYFIAEFLTKYYNLGFMSRVEAMFVQDSRSDSISIGSRLTSFRGGIDQWLSNPVFGSTLIEEATGFYPHNLWVESLMAVGLFGTMFLVIMVGISIQNLWVICKNEIQNLWIALIFLQLLIFQQFSGNVWSSTALFGMMSAVVATGVKVRKALNMSAAD